VHDHNLVIAFTGPRGAGKTLTLTAWVMCYVARHGGQVWANFAMGWPSPEGPLWRAMPLEVEQWVSLSPDLAQGVVCIDEIQHFADSRRSNTVLNRLLGYLTMQSRKRQLSLYYTVQNMQWLDKRIQWLTDIEVACRDLALTPWGREKELERGRLIGLTVIDHSGYLSGQPGARCQLVLRGYRFWGAYDTYQVRDVWEAMSRVEVKADRLVIDARSVSDEALPAKLDDWAAFVAAWWRRFGERPVTVNKLMDLAQQRGLLQELWADREGRGGRISLGKEINKRQGSVIGRWTIRSPGSRSGSRLYRLVPVRQEVGI